MPYIIIISLLFLESFYGNHSSALYAQQTTVYTCNGSPVIGNIYNELTAVQIAAAADIVQAQYPNVQILDAATSSYNCHAYAYHLTEGQSNRIWINHHDASFITNSNIQKYWTDCYQITTNPAAAVKIYYTGDHSAVAEGNGMYISKWGSWPLIRHAPNHVPAAYHPDSRAFAEFRVNGNISAGWRYNQPRSIPPHRFLSTHAMISSPSENTSASALCLSHQGFAAHRRYIFRAKWYDFYGR